MPLLRRPHDHRRELRARRRTPRPAIARSRDQSHDAMTPITASLHLPPTGEPRFRRRIAVAPPPPTARPMPSIRLNCPVDCRGGAKLATAIVDPPPITPASASTRQAAAQSNPHRRQAVARPPRVPSWEAFGRRPSARADKSPRAGIRNPSPKPTFCAEGGHSRDTAVTENGLSCSDLRSHTAAIGPACSAGTVSSRSRGKVN